MGSKYLWSKLFRGRKKLGSKSLRINFGQQSFKEKTLGEQNFRQQVLGRSKLEENSCTSKFLGVFGTYLGSKNFGSNFCE